jgi:NAD(P) transhydrogenase subunit alpha
MRVAVLRETLPGETRVALMPEAAKTLLQQGVEMAVQAGCGASAGASDEDYAAAGATVYQERADMLALTGILATVNPPSDEVLLELKPGTLVAGFLRPLDNPQILLPAVEHGLVLLSMELVPRITRAQEMDTLSSMATVAGYKAVLIAANHLPKMFPLLMTAAGTVPPAKVLVIGAGVAGLQAIATARRLGAVVTAYDVRRAASEQIASLGARTLEIDLGGIETEDTGGYAKELSPEALERGRQAVAQAASLSDVVIATAQIPGHKAPMMMNRAAVEGMKHGAVIVDLAAPSGGNTELTEPGETIVHNGVTIFAPLNLPAEIPVHASQLYSRNMTNFLKLFLAKGEVQLNRNDEIVQGALVACEGKIVNQRVAAALAQQQGGTL